MVSKPAVIQFLTKGFVSAERPGGFTAFMFSPPRKLSYGKRDRKRNLRMILGDKREIVEEDLEFYAKNDFYIPRSVHKGELQVQLAIKFLELLTHRQSIATDGYYTGLELLDDYRNDFFDAQEHDKFFMAKFVNLLDTVFRNFNTKLASYHDDRDPIRAARHTLRSKMAIDIKRAMGSMEYGLAPTLPLPPRLLEHVDQKDKSPREPSNAKPATDAPEWHTKNPSPDTNWTLPKGKMFRDLFDPSTTVGRANIGRFPRAKHHNPQIKLSRNICIRYQAEGKCRVNCNMSHIPPNKMPPELHKEISSAFQQAYK